MVFHHRHNELLSILCAITAFQPAPSHPLSLSPRPEILPLALNCLSVSEPLDRRLALFQSARALAGAGTTLSTVWDATSAASAPKICCRLGLPPRPEGSVRIYLCRHGQTENNRLHRLQGRGVDPPLNDNGVAMAKRLGVALRNSIDGDERLRRAGLETTPVPIFHSPMLRAEQTASIAEAQFPPPSSSAERIALDSLIELDFTKNSAASTIARFSPRRFTLIGGNEAGTMPSREEVRRTYERWEAGHVDEKLGRESAREILDRCSSALSEIVEGARRSRSGSAVAVGHGSLLGILMAVALDLPLAGYAGNLRLGNASVSVLDVDIGAEPEARTIEGSCLFEAHTISRSQFCITVPKSKAVRVNEIRHLTGIRRT